MAGSWQPVSQLIFVILSITLQPIASRVEPSNSNERLLYLGSQRQQWQLPSSLAADFMYRKQLQHQLHSQYLNNLRQQQQETIDGQHQGLDENRGADFKGSLVHLLPRMGDADLQQQQVGSIRNDNNLMLTELSNIDGLQLINALNQHHHQLNNHLQLHNGTARSLGHSQSGDNQQPRDAGELPPHPSNKLEGDQNNNEDSIKSSDNGQASRHQPLQQVDKTIEPRQRRRIFNRILKKADWNHLFVELSKVFLRYFLDLALKDIIGKQSGTGSDGTTSGKKLDAQAELTDLLKDFVKTAISNI